MILKNLKDALKVKFWEPYQVQEVLDLASKWPEFAEQAGVIQKQYEDAVNDNIRKVKK
jgi:hypothetical protein